MTKTFCNGLKMVMTIFSSISSLTIYLVKLKSLIFFIIVRLTNELCMTEASATV